MGAYNSMTERAARNQTNMALAARVVLREMMEKTRVAARAMTMMISKARTALWRGFSQADPSLRVYLLVQLLSS